MTLDTLGSLMFLAGFLAAIGLGLLVLATREHLEIRRYLRNRRLHPFADLPPKTRRHHEAARRDFLASRERDRPSRP